MVNVSTSHRRRTHTPMLCQLCEQPYYTKAVYNQRRTQATKQLLCGSGALTRLHVDNVDDHDDKPRANATKMRIWRGTTHVHPPPRDNEPLAPRYQETTTRIPPSGFANLLVITTYKPLREPNLLLCVTSILLPQLLLCGNNLLLHVTPTSNPAAIICPWQTSLRGVLQARLYECCAFMGFATRGPHWLYTWMLPPITTTTEQSFAPPGKLTLNGAL